ncbi:uncharacterized protein [Haliotis asinina]|uniref:uncharacterized protein n=1 Tax=Haliotis asinina TaxID=109174 RepID=UPI003531F7E7
MSEKSTGAEPSSQLDPLQLALKKVYSIHKEKIRELADEREEYKKGYDHLGQHKIRLLEKVRNLQNQNDILYSENTRLRNVLDDLRARDGRGSGKCQMCEHLQGSMSAIQEAYKHSLEEKEKMIHYLEERLSESNKQVPMSNLNLSNLLTPNTSFDGADCVLGRSPVSTAKDKNGNSSTTASLRTKKALTQRHCTENRVDESAEKVTQRSSKRRGANLRRNECSDEADTAGKESSQKTTERHLEAGDTKTPHVRPCAERDGICSTLHSTSGREGRGQTMSVDEEVCRSDGSSDKESPESARLRKLRLGRKLGKRSRYTEDTVQENKKHKFDNSHVLNTSDESHGHPDPAQPPKHSKRIYHVHQSRVLVQETCDPDTDRTASMSSDGSPEKPPRTSLAAKCDTVDFGVVPETLGMGLTSSESESDSEIDTQDTVRAKSVDGSPDNVLVSPPSDVDDKIEKVKQILDRRNSTVSDRRQEEEKSASRNNENKCESRSTSDHHRKGLKSSASVDMTKLALDDMNGKDMSPKPLSPVFSGVKASRQGIESPFLFEEDRPGSSKSSRRRSANISGILSDQESPLLLKPVEAAYSNECGQSPSLKEASRISDVSARRRQERNHTDSECLQAGRTSQERLQRTVHARNLRKSEKLKQTTLSQAFTSSPPGLSLNLSPTKPEERAAIDKAIRLSLQEIHGNTEIGRTKKPLFVRTEDKPGDTENVPPVFKRPPSPRSLRSPVKKTSPNKKSPHKQKSDRPSRTQHDHDDVIDLDETVAPDSASFDTFSNKGGNVDQMRKLPVHVLNESLDPDVSLTQYCSDTELLSQRPGLRRGMMRGSRKDLRSDQGLRSGSHSQGSEAASLDVREETGNRKKAGNHNLRSNSKPTDLASIDAKPTFNKKKKDGKGSACESGNEEDMKNKLRTTTSSVPSFDSFNEGVSLDHDDYLTDSGVSKLSANIVSGTSKPSASVEAEGPSLHTQDHEENEADVTLDPKFMKAHMFQGQMDIDSVQTDSDSIPLSSRSFKFGSSKSSKSGDSQGKEARIGDDEDELGEEEHTITPDGRDRRRESFNDSFDRVPRKQQADYAYVDVVRKKVERQQLKASSCQECYEYYKSKGCSEEEIQQQIQDCSRHRARYLPPSTPEHFWSIGFPDTQECEERGYIHIESPSKQKPGYRRRRKLTKRFKSRGEEENDSQTDTQK